MLFLFLIRSMRRSVGMQIWLLLTNQCTISDTEIQWALRHVSFLFCFSSLTVLRPALEYFVHVKSLIGTQNHWSRKHIYRFYLKDFFYDKPDVLRTFFLRVFIGVFHVRNSRKLRLHKIACNPTSLMINKENFTKVY